MRQVCETPRALRRHHRERLMAKRRFHFGRDLFAPGEEKALAKAARTPAPCSCLGCGNPRKHFNEASIGERRDSQDWAGLQGAWRSYVDDSPP